MGLFGKKKECEICGKDLSFFGSVKLSDAKICDECFMKAEIAAGELSGKKETLDSIKGYIDIFESEKEKTEEQFGEGKAVFRAESTGKVSLEEILVGLPTARALNGLVYVYGYVLNGTFKERREAVIIHDGLKIPVNIMAACPCNKDDDLNLLLAKDQPRNKAIGPVKAKLILDIYNEGMISKGEYILLKGGA